MTMGGNGYQIRRAMTRWGKARFRAVGLIALVIGAMVAVSTIVNGGANPVAAQMADGLGVLEKFDVLENRGVVARNAWDLGSEAMTTTWPAIPSYSSASGLGWPSGSGGVESPTREVYVWATFMTVGVSTDGTMTYAGYMPATNSGSEGSLAHTSFTYAGTDYTVQGIFHQQVNGEMQQVVFSADKRLPDHLTFYAGNREFRVSDSQVLSANENIHAWRVDEGPGWSENQRVVLALVESYGGHPHSDATSG